MCSSLRFTASAAVVMALIVAVSASASGCYDDGERCIGAKGYPYVTYKKCCSGKSHLTVDYDWGSWCGAPKHLPKKCALYKHDGYYTKDYEPCGHGYKCVVPESGGYEGWYKKDFDPYMYCMPSGDYVEKDDGKHYAEHSCYKNGERCIGEHKHPYVPYMPCCDGYPAKKVDYHGKYDWGYFCVGYSKPAEKYVPAKRVCYGDCTGKIVPCGYKEYCPKKVYPKKVYPKVYPPVEPSPEYGYY